jgi:cyclitol reductase
MMLPVGRRFSSLVLTEGGVELRRDAVRPRDRDPKLLLAPTLVGVCRSDLKEIAGQRAVRRDFGHELVADVLASDPPGILTGARVCLDPHPVVERTSGFAELVEISGPEGDLLAALPRLPKDLPAEVAVFVEPLACAVHCVRRWSDARPPARPPASVAVVGAGMAGCLIAAVLERGGAQVTLWNRSAERLEELRRRDVLPGIALRSLREEAAERFDDAIVATSTLVRDVFEWAAAHLRPGGNLVLYAGTHPGMDTVPGVDVDAVRRGQQRVRMPHGDAWLVGSHGAVADDFRAAIDLLADTENGLGERLRRAITRRLTLEEAASVLPEQVEHAPFGKTVVAFDGGSATALPEAA